MTSQHYQRNEKVLWLKCYFGKSENCRCTEAVVRMCSVKKVFCKKGTLKNFAKLTGKNLCQSFFFNKVAGLKPATLLKKRLWHRWYPVNFAKFLRRHFFIEISNGCFWTWSTTWKVECKIKVSRNPFHDINTWK